MLVSKEKAVTMYNDLHPHEKQRVQVILLDLKRRYVSGGFRVDIPYFFWSLNKPMFQDDEYHDFIEINDSKVFVINAIYIISRFLKKMKGGNTNAEKKEKGHK